METLEIKGDGAKWGVSDWYDEVRAALQKELAKGPRHYWSTGWYGVKKEIQSGRITCYNGTITCEASVSDDFDTDGYGKASMAFTKDLDAIARCMDDALHMADGDSRDNRCYAGYQVIGPTKGGHRGWIETYIMPVGAGEEMDQPPGDHYHQWGWQGQGEIPAAVRTRLESWMIRHSMGRASHRQCSCKGFTVRPWEGE